MHHGTLVQHPETKGKHEELLSAYELRATLKTITKTRRKNKKNCFAHSLCTSSMGPIF